jgi:drug/metabolite transporter (DMT)-like permease
MSLAALSLVVVAAFIHAYWNLLVKRADGGPAFVWMFSFWSTVWYAPIVVILIVIEPLQYGWREYALILSSGILHLAYAMSLNHGYRVSDLSVVYPIARGSGPVVAAIAAVIVLGERPSVLGACGIALIVAGIIVIVGGWRLVSRRRDPRAAKGLVFGLLTGLCIASYTVNDAYAVKVLLVAPLMIDYFGNVVRLAFLTPTTLSNREALRDEWRRNRNFAMKVGALMPLSYILSLYAMRLAPVSYVAPARELSMLVGAYFGARLLREGHSVERVVGAALMVAGIAAIMTD